MRKIKSPCRSSKGFRRKVRRLFGVGTAVVLVVTAGRLSLFAEDAEFAADEGPQEIDVSTYAKPLQKSYELFQKRCTQCHNLARAVNSDYALPDEWERYIKRMQRKPGSELVSKEAKEIYEFLVYDAAQRKQPTLQAKLEGLSPEERKAAEEKLRQVLEKYQRE